MRKDKYKINIDKLTLGYNVSSDSLLQNLKDESVLNLTDFKLVKIDSKHFKNAYNILFLWSYDDTDKLEWHLFGQLKFNLKIEKKEDEVIKKAWIYFDNRSLYTEFYKGANIIKLVEILENALNMELNNITSLDIAFDTTKNIRKSIISMFKNKAITTYLNTNKVKDRKEERNDIFYIKRGCLDKIIESSTSLYVQQKDRDGFGMTIYNKSKEIQEKSHKEYIKYWNKMNTKQTIYRAEIRLKNEHIKKYLTDKCITISYDLFNNEDFLFDCFISFVNRLIRFEEGNKEYNIIDILKLQLPINKEGSKRGIYRVIH